MHRVIIAGGPGSGKSTLARALSARTGLPVVHLDRFQWLPGWETRPSIERDRIIREAAEEPRWIMDGNYFETLHHRLRRADTVIWLDLPVWHRYARVTWRILAGYGRTRADMQEACPERFDAEFYRFIWRTRETARAPMLALFANPPGHLTLHRLTSAGAVSAFLADLDQASGAAVRSANPRVT